MKPMKHDVDELATRRGQETESTHARKGGSLRWGWIVICLVFALVLRELTVPLLEALVPELWQLIVLGWILTAAVCIAAGALCGYMAGQEHVRHGVILGALLGGITGMFGAIRVEEFADRFTHLGNVRAGAFMGALTASLAFTTFGAWLTSRRRSLKT